MRHTHNASEIPLRRRVVQGRRSLVAESAPQPCHRSGCHTRRQRDELSWRRVVLLQLHLLLGHRRWRSVTESGPDFGHPRFGCLTPRQRTSVRFLPRSRGRRRRRSMPGGWSNLTTHRHSSHQKVAPSESGSNSTSSEAAAALCPNALENSSSFSAATNPSSGTSRGASPLYTTHPSPQTPIKK